MPKCPIGCGDCCDDWAYVEVLWTKERHYLNRDDPCPNLGPDGCVLPRNQRPKVCREHLCARAMHVLEAEKRHAASKRARHEADSPAPVPDLPTSPPDS